MVYGFFYQVDFIGSILSRNKDKLDIVSSNSSKLIKIVQIKYKSKLI